MGGVGTKSKIEKKSTNRKILHVKDTDRTNQTGSEIDSEVKIFDIFGPFRPFSPTPAGWFYFSLTK